MDRILIIGCSGAGKSTLARQLGDILGLPVVHLDQAYWQPGWTPLPDGAWTQRAATLAQRNRWIMDGNYGGTLAMRLARAEAVIFLDYPRWRCLWQVSKRIRLHRGQTRPDMGPDCPERWDWGFIRFVWGFKKRGRKRNYQMIQAQGMLDKTVILKSPRETKAFIGQVNVTGKIGV